MIESKIKSFLIDKGGRRHIKDRRFRLNVTHIPDKRTGLSRRSGWDRRCQQVPLLNGINRRIR